MATYNADIRIGVVGKSSLNQLEAQLKRVNKQVTALQKSVKLRGLNQRISLDTRAAMTAVDALQRKIDRLNRNIKITADTRVRERTERTGGGGAAASPAAAIAVTPAQTANLKQTASLYDQIGSTLDRNNQRLRGIEALDAKRKQVAEEINDTIKRRNDLVDEQAQKIKRVTSVATSENFDKARNAVFGGTIPGRSAAQAYQDVQQQIQALGPKILQLNGQIAEQRAEYMNVTQAVNQLDAAERKRQRNAVASLDEIDARLQKQAARQKARTGALKGAGVGAGAAALQIPGVSGVASGGLAGFAVGGAPGAAAGAAAAAVTELAVALGTYGAEAAKAATETDLLRRALVGVVGGAEYADALEGINEITRDFNQEIGSTTQSFTKLAAATRANGLNAQETTDVYKGLAAANLALGGDAQKLEGILLATSQVFSKGKVQAEELRGQIGERLPGAFALFARSLGISTAQLDKALEQGEVSVEDFVNFTKFLFEQYEKDAEKIAKSPEAAAARLTSNLSLLQDSVGKLLKPIRQNFLETANFIVEQLTRVSNFLNRMVMKQQEDNIRLLKLARSGAINSNNFELAQEIQEKIDAARDVLNELKYGPQSGGQPLGQNGGGDTGETPEQKRKREADEKAAKRLAEQQARQARINDLLKSDQLLKQQLLSLEERRNELTQMQADKLELLYVFDADIRKINRTITDEKQKQLAIENRKLDLAKDVKALENQEAVKAQQATKALDGLVNEIANQGLVTNFEKVNEAVAEISPGMQAANQAGNELFRTFEKLVFATENWRDTLVDVLKSLSSMFLKLALGNLAGGDGKGLFSFLNGSLNPSTAGSSIAPLANQPNFSSNLGSVNGLAGFKAGGGRVSGASPYVVGEKGPELFVPGKTGTIVPADVFSATRSAIAGNGKEGGDSDAFDQNAAAIGASSTISKEKIIERNMMRASQAPVDVRYESTVINSVEYVTADQFQQGIKDSVKQSRASVYKELRNKPAARSGVGI